MERLKISGCAMFLCLALGTGMVFAAGETEKESKPAEVFGDTVEYSVKTGVAKAKGHVSLKQDGAVMTGEEAEYNTKTETGTISGNVKADKEELHMTCDSFTVVKQNHFLAAGNVHAVQKDKSFIGPKAEYFADQDYVLMEAGGTAASADGTFTADFMEGWIGEEHFKGIGNAHIISPPRDFEGGGDVAEYWGKESGKAVLTGNAWAVQENNTLKSKKITIFLADDKLQTKDEEK